MIMADITELQKKYEAVAGSGDAEKSLALFYVVREKLESGELRVA